MRVLADSRVNLLGLDWPAIAHSVEMLAVDFCS